MRRVLLSVGVLLLGAAILGATVFREQAAVAAQAILPVRVVNTAAEPVPVVPRQPTATRVEFEQGLLATNSAVTRGFDPPITASQVIATFRNGKAILLLRNDVGNSFIELNRRDPKSRKARAAQRRVVTSWAHVAPAAHLWERRLTR
jgi:hypothetical protein